MLKKCPKCGSKRIAPILYGMPVFSKEMERQVKEEKLYLGGCCISEAGPEYHCFECKKDIGSPPILISRQGKEDYRNIVTMIHFRDGSFFSGYQEILIKKLKDKILLDISPGFREPGTYMQSEITEYRWNQLLDRLYCRLYIHEWKKNFVNMNVLDGEQWELELKLTGGRVRNYRGSNAFPPYWPELRSTFRPFFKKEGIMF